MKNPFLIIIFFVVVKFYSQNWGGLGVNHPSSGYIHCLYTDTVNNILYAGGMFDSIGGKNIRCVAKWNGVNWDSLGSGIDFYAGTPPITQVRKIIGYHNKIYVFGNFGQAGPYFMNGMGIWNGASWDSISEVPNGYINDAVVFNDTLYICGGFNQIGSLQTRYAAKFDGTNWYSMNFPFDAGTSFFGIRPYNGKFYAAGQFLMNGYGLLTEWDGTNWNPWVGVQGDVTKTISGLEVIDNQLVVYGRYWGIAGIWSSGIMSWDGTTWFGYGGGVTSPSYATIHNVKKFNNKLHVVGGFTYAGGQGNGSDQMYATWDGADWCVTNDLFDNILKGIEVYNNELIVGGGFSSINGDSSIRKIAKWIGGNFTSSCGNTIGINQKEVDENYLKVFPNPANKFLNIETDLQNEVHLEILDVTGKVVIAIIFTEQKTQIDISELPLGMYFIRLTSEEKVYAKKFLKQ